MNEINRGEKLANWLIFKKGQILIFVIFLFIFLGLIISSFFQIWRNENYIRRSYNYKQKSLYIAESGVEYAKVVLAGNELWNGVSGMIFAGGQINITVQNSSCPPGPWQECRLIISEGIFKNVSQQVTVLISLDMPPPSPANFIGDEAVVDGSWQEL